MATIRRLSDEDVKAVFDCVHNNRAPPGNLPFRLVNVGPKGLKLSPPSYEFDDGLYVLLKPIKKKGKKEKDAAQPYDPRSHPSIPSNLLGHVMTETPSAICPWSLSGPQFPQPTAIQQRYCYPKGEAEYSSRKGGALWTMYLDNGKEDLEFRLLHVYYSAKRAVNKGMSVPVGIASTPKRHSSPKKKQRKSKKSRNPDIMPSLGSPAADSAESSVGSSPLSFQVPPPSPSKDPALTKAYSTSKFITPEKEGVPEAFHPIQFVNDAGRSVGVSVAHPHHHHIRPKHSVPYQYAVGYSPGLPRRSSMPYGGRPYPPEPKTPSRAHQPHTQFHPYQMQQTTPSYDPFPLEGDANPLDMDATSWPFGSPGKMPNGFPTPETRDANDSSATQQDQIQAFAVKLDTIHDSIKDMINNANESEQGHLVNILSGWAKRVAQMPLGNTSGSSGGGNFPGPPGRPSRQHSWAAAASHPHHPVAQGNHHPPAHQQQIPQQNSLTDDDGIDRDEAERKAAV